MEARKVRGGRADYNMEKIYNNVIQNFCEFIIEFLVGLKSGDIFYSNFIFSIAIPLISWLSRLNSCFFIHF